MYLVRNVCPYCSGEEYLFIYAEYAIEFAQKLAIDCIDKYNLNLDKEKVKDEIDMWGCYPELCQIEEIKIQDKYKPAFTYQY